MNFDFRWFIILGGNILFLLLTELVNDALAPITLSLYLNGLLIFVPILLLPFNKGLLCVMLTGMIADVIEILPFGTQYALKIHLRRG